MSQINKVLYVFLLSIAILLFLIWRVIHSQQFAKILVNNTKKHIAAQISPDLDFEKVSLEFFPPGARIHNVKFAYKSKDNLDISVYSASLVFSFNMFDAFNNKISFKEIMLEDGIIDVRYESPETESELSFDQMWKTIDDLPVHIKAVRLKNQLVKFNESRVDVNNFKLGIDKKNFDALVDIENIYDPNLKIITKESGIDVVKGHLVLNRTELVFGGVSVTHNFSEAVVYGKIMDVYKNPVPKIDVKFKVYLPSINYLTDKYIGLVFKNGFIEASAEIDSGLLEKTKVQAHFTDLDTNYFHATSLDAKVSINNKILTVKDGKLEYRDSKLDQLSDLVLYNFRANKFEDFNASFYAKNINLSNALKSQQDYLDPFKGAIDGFFTFSLDNDRVHFKSLKDMVLKDFKLSVDSDKGEKILLSNHKVNLDNAVFSISKDEFFMTSDLAWGESRMTLKGQTGNSRLRFSTENADIQLSDFGKIAGLDVKGKGKILMSVDGPSDDINLKINGILSNTYFENFLLGTTNNNINLSFKKKEITLNNSSGKVGNSIYYANGSFNYDKNHLNIEVKTPQTSFQDVKNMYEPIIKHVPYWPETSSGLFKIGYVASGPVDLNKIEIKGEVSGNNINVYNETFQKIQTGFSFRKNILELEDITVLKDTGALKGEFTYDNKDSSFEFTSRFNNFKLESFNLIRPFTKGTTGQVSGKLRYRKSTKPELELKATLENVKVLGEPQEPSQITASYLGGKIEYEAGLFSDEITSSGALYPNNPQKTSTFKLSINIQHIKKVLISVFGRYVKDFNLKGKIDSDIWGSFHWNNFEQLSLNAKISEFSIEKDERKILNVKDQNVQIKNGEILQWNIKSEDDQFTLYSIGSGHLNSKYSITASSLFDMELLEILSPSILKSSGLIKAQAKISNDYPLNLNLSSPSYSLSYDGLPFTLGDAKIAVKYENNRIVVEEIEAKIGTGSGRVTGIITPALPFPEVKLKYVLDSAHFYFLKRSLFVVSGDGAVEGIKLPYVISGDLQIEKSEINSEFNELSDDKAGTATYRYLPVEDAFGAVNLLELNVKTTTMTPIMVKNSQVDLAMVGNMHILGPVTSPKISGHLATTPGRSKFFFKSNEFIVAKGDVFFPTDAVEINPEIDFMASSTITRYKILMRIFGNAKNFKIALSSDPALSQKDIFSLMAFGFTDEQTTQLTGQARSEMSQVGVGSMLLDNLKINQSLKSEFGLKVNVGSVLTNTEASLLQGTSGGTGAGVGRTRSATKIEVQKKLSEALNLSVSSTLGGGVGQRQSMNLNYKINDKYSVEGVYESKAFEQGQEDIIGNSLGVDFKIKWSQK
ncbi:MAG: translocation/assembly module TamB domain-containing protein [Bacteriovoracaceae bacterium]|nr:translocation/assembly module TamB domain-containing protein [Bacteriovoracaceae bacterium]